MTARKAFSEADKKTGEIKWVITLNTTGDATLNGYSVKEDFFGYSEVSESASEDNQSYRFDFDFDNYISCVVKRGDQVLTKGVDYKTTNGDGITFINYVDAPDGSPVTIEVNTKLTDGFPSGVTYLYNKAIVKDREGEQEPIDDHGTITNYKLDVEKSIRNNTYPTVPNFDQVVEYIVEANKTLAGLPDGKVVVTDVLPVGMEFVDDGSWVTC